MDFKKPLKSSQIFFAISISLLYSSNGFCNEIDNYTSISNLQNIKYKLAEPITRNFQNNYNNNDTSNFSESSNENSQDVYRLNIEEDQEKRFKRMRKSIRTMEIIYQTFNAVDAVQTISCMQKPNCEEKNPLYGKRPSTGKIIAIKSLAGLLHFTAYKRGTKEDSRLKSTLIMEAVSIGIQGLVVGLNFRTLL